MKSAKRPLAFYVLATCLMWVAPICVAQTPASQKAAASTAVPSRVPYAAIAMDAGGKPLHGQISVTFQLYENEVGGDPLWSEAQTVSFDAAGHYDVQLGATLPNGVPVAVFSSGNARWLDVRIAGQSQQPRVLMTSVPYAFKSADTSALGGLPASAFVHVDAAASPVSPAANATTGKGTLTSVGLSAPSSDFNVNGPPVITSGTLALHWTTPPASANGANSIVKRDATGSFAAGTITATQAQGTGLNNYGVGGAGTGRGVTGYGMSNQAVQNGVVGMSHGSGPVSDGVHGVSSNPVAAGVQGVSTTVSGVFGIGGIGVFGTGSQYGFVADSNVAQDHNSGGWIKAMAYVNAQTPPYSISRCYNSTLPRNQATTPPCGFDLEEVAEEVFDLHFHFDVYDRFYAASVALGPQDGDLDVEPAGSDGLEFSSFRGTFSNPAGAQYTVVVF